MDVTIRNVAKKANVPVSTVSRVLNGNDKRKEVVFFKSQA